VVCKLPYRPDFTPSSLSFNDIPVFQYAGSLKDEIEAGTLSPAEAMDMLEWILGIRAFEEMIVTARMQMYEPLREIGFLYRGATHLSVGQEATSVGACSGIDWRDYLTSTHRGHGDALAKGYTAVAGRTEDEMREWIGRPEADAVSGEELVEMTKGEHLYRTVAELFGKADGYCKGRGGGMHIADFASSQLGANAIVGGSVPIATGAALSSRFFRDGKVALCFAGDGSYSNGAVLESLNFSAQHQFTNPDLHDEPFGVPVVYVIVNNLYGMTGQQRGEVSGLDYLARRAAGFSETNMHAEVVNGMDVLAVRDAVQRGAELCRNGEGPVLIEAITYRFYGHSLSDPRTDYRSKEDEAAWRAFDPTVTFAAQIIDAGVATQEQIDEMIAKVDARLATAAVRAAQAADPDASEVMDYVFTDGFSTDVPPEAQNVVTKVDPPVVPRKDGMITYKGALTEALVEEMMRDKRVVFYGEDVADYGGAFRATTGLVEAFGRNRVFNAPISEVAIIGTAVGASMTGMRPVVELMYSDFEFQASDQLYNQAAKWHYMSGGQTTVPLVVRSSVGAGKGYGGQHSQALEAHAAHTPGIYVVCPSTPYDLKGLLKSSIRDDNPVLFVESQALYNVQGVVPEEEYLVPLGKAAIRREGKDVTIIAWSMFAHMMLEAGEILANEHGVDAELIDLRTLVPLDMETVLASVRKTGHCVVACQACRSGSFAAEVAARIQEEAFDYLDGPVARIGAADAISPQSEILEAAYLPNVGTIVQVALDTCYKNNG